MERVIGLLGVYPRNARMYHSKLSQFNSFTEKIKKTQGTISPSICRQHETSNYPES